MTEEKPSEDEEDSKGSEKDFGALLAVEIPGLYRYAFFLVRQEIEAEEVVGGTIVRAWEHRNEFRGEASLRTWLHQILRRLAIDRSRHQSHEVRVENIEEDWNDEGFSVDAEKIVERAEIRSELLDALSHIPIEYRDVVVLHDAEGWTIAEIASLLGIGVSAIKQRLRRGRMMVVSSLAKGEERRVANKGVVLSCATARAQVSDYLDGELAPPKGELLKEHLSECASCPALYTALVGVKQSLGHLHDPNTVIPAEVARRIKDALSHS